MTPLHAEQIIPVGPQEANQLDNNLHRNAYWYLVYPSGDIKKVIGKRVPVC